MSFAFFPLTHKLVTVIEPWFDDADTVRHLGGREWIHQAHALTKSMPGFTFGGFTVLARHAWIVGEKGCPVALLDVEVYDDRTASLAIVVSLQRHR